LFFSRQFPNDPNIYGCKPYTIAIYWENDRGELIHIKTRAMVIEAIQTMKKRSVTNGCPYVIHELHVRVDNLTLYFRPFLALFYPQVPSAPITCSKSIVSEGDRIP
jgi:hypothetical protein